MDGLTPQQCDALHKTLDDAILGKAVRKMIESGGVSEILHEAISRQPKGYVDRYAFTTYVDFRLREALPLSRFFHEHGL